MVFSQNLVPQSLEDLLYERGIELIVSDFQGTAIDSGNYKRSGAWALGKHIVKQRDRDKLKKGYKLFRNLEKYSVEERTKVILEICEGLGIEAAIDFGDKLVGYINENLVRFLQICNDINSSIQRAFISIDDRRVVEPTLTELAVQSLPIHKYIVNEVVAVGGKLTQEIKSYAMGVAKWGGIALNSDQSKLDAFKVLIEPYGPSSILYINDDDVPEAKIDRYMEMEGSGSNVIKNYDLPKFFAPTLI